MTAVVQRLVVVSASGEFSEYVPAVVGGAASAGMAVALDPNTGLLSLSMMPIGIGPDFVLITATETINTGAFVDVWNSGTFAAPVFSTRNADATVAGKGAKGFAPAAIASGASGMIYLSSLNTSVSGVLPGPAFLSDTAIGGFLQQSSAGVCPITAAGHVLQQIGYGASPTSIQFYPQRGVIRA